MFGEEHGVVGDVDAEVADAFQVVVDLEHGHNVAQVHGHRLVEGQELEALLLHLHLVLVDDQVGENDLPGGVGVAALDGGERLAQVVLHDRAQGEDLLLESLDLSLQMSCHRCPVLPSRSGR